MFSVIKYKELNDKYQLKSKELRDLKKFYSFEMKIQFFCSQKEGMRQNELLKRN
ncbi:MAG: hypothetical protein ACQKHC_01885 [Candidatus Phytoplasma pruni]